MSAVLTVDIIPILRLLVSRSMIENHVTRLENATIENFHAPRNWLDKHRLYFSIERFEAHPEMD